MKIFSPMAYGNGAYILHKTLEKHLKGYGVREYSPYLTLFPILLKTISIPHDIDLIHTTPDYAPFFLKKNKPLLITFHGYSLGRDCREYNSILQNIHYATALKLFTNLAVQKSTHITAVSKHTASIVENQHNPTDKIRVIYNGVDEQFFRPLSKHKKKRNVKVLFAGNLKRQKGAHWLPEICKKAGTELEFYATTGLMNLPQKLQNIKSVGVVNHQDMPNLYNDMDILLMPTVREGFGLVVAEAMACGLPVVATNCTALPELIDHGKGGYLCKIGDTSDFAEKINILAKSPSLRHIMGEYNRSKIESHFTLKRMVAEYHTLFEEIHS